MSYRLFILFCFLPLFIYCKPSPEEQIIIVENFISAETAERLINFYNRANKTLSTSSDNQIDISSLSDPSIKKLIKEISTKVIGILGDSSYHLDHGGLYARIRGNYCPYHADNISFFCPIHGKNQQELRSSCPGNCPGSQYIPNHTPWREYTALIYLNDDFEGGEIAFEDGPCNQIYQKVIPIEAHMLVLAPNGSHFYHEVYPIKQGKRHSLHLWYTRDPSHNLRF